MSITFNANWSPNGTPTDVAMATIGILNATTNTQVVADGTAMSHGSTGNYYYEYDSDVTGNLYLGTMLLIATNGARGSFEQAIYAGAAITPIGPITNSTQMISLLQQQLGGIASAKISALYAISGGESMNLPGPSYNISGKSGGESLDLNGYRAVLLEQIKTLTELELNLMQSLQDLQPFQINQRVGIGCRRGGCW